ncbi:DUF3231 family protein [Paenibacillus tarimensis]|uniref:DUF3231 family protein n=1 Tax=Paenibacillus tarimensis TaxID=416012 RepID=UPI001F3B47E8|nr:DUF3231 family protein [Paenibacillus tarimensis]MCF2943591.1 DUF3231 family protein [Paenibacillus tarimensis]
METNHNIQLTAGEISQLWTTYLNDTMAVCVLGYFNNKVQDTEIKPVVEYALSLSEKHLQTISFIFNQENHPVPKGFTKEDVKVNAQRLYTDPFILYYLKLFGRLALFNYSFAVDISARKDVRAFFSECIASSLELNRLTSEVLLSKGLYLRPPYIPTPESAEFVQKQNFLNGFFGDTRPVNSIEISHLFEGILTNSLGKATLMGFMQAAQHQEIKKYLKRGVEIAEKHVAVFSDFLRKDDLPAPTSFESCVTDSTDSPFSEKLMMYHTSALIQAGNLNYGFALALSMRNDLSASYSRLMAEVLKYAEDGINIMIDNEWLEKPPQAVERAVIADI